MNTCPTCGKPCGDEAQCLDCRLHECQGMDPIRWIWLLVILSIAALVVVCLGPCEAHGQDYSALMPPMTTVQPRHRFKTIAPVHEAQRLTAVTRISTSAPVVQTRVAAVTPNVVPGGFTATISVSNKLATVRWTNAPSGAIYQVQSSTNLSAWNPRTNSTGTSWTGPATSKIELFRIVAVPTNAASQWVNGYGGTSYNYGQALAVDGAGNIIIAGAFSGTTDFGAGPLTSAGGVDMMLGKYSPSGACIWAKDFGGVGNETPIAVAVDASGNIYVAGNFTGTPSTAGCLPLVNVGQGDIFVAKYSSAGACLWSESFGGPGNDLVNGMALDNAGNLVIIGTINETWPAMIVFGTTSLYSFWGSDTFVAKLSGTDGHSIWAENFANDGNDQGSGVVVDSNADIYITGRFQVDINFGNGYLSINDASYDVYVAKLSGANGNAVWSQRAGGQYGDKGVSIAVDPSGNVLLAGAFASPSISFGSLTLNNAAAGYDDSFVVKLSGANGSAMWGTSFGSPYLHEDPTALAVDKSGNVIVAGNMPAFDTFTIGETKLTSSGTQDTYLAKFSGNGAPLWATHWGGSGATVGCAGITTDAGGNIEATGYFLGSVNFGVGTISSASSYNLFTIRLNP